MASGHLTSLPSLRASDEGRKRDTASPGAPHTPAGSSTHLGSRVCSARFPRPASTHATHSSTGPSAAPRPAWPLTLDLVNDAPQSPLYLPTLQPILPPNEDEVEEQQEEERRGVHQLHPAAGSERGGAPGGAGQWGAGGLCSPANQGPTLPSPPLSASDSSWPRDCRFPRDPGSDRGGQFPVSPGGYGGRRGTSPDPVLREVGRSTPHPPRATGHVPASRLAPTASQQQEHSQEHERGARPVETGAAVPVVQEAVSPHLLGAGGGRVRGWGTSRRREGAGTL